MKKKKKLFNGVSIIPYSTLVASRYIQTTNSCLRTHAIMHCCICHMLEKITVKKNCTTWLFCRYWVNTMKLWGFLCVSVYRNIVSSFFVLLLPLYVYRLLSITNTHDMWKCCKSRWLEIKIERGRYLKKEIPQNKRIVLHINLLLLLWGGDRSLPLPFHYIYCEIVLCVAFSFRYDLYFY